MEQRALRTAEILRKKLILNLRSKGTKAWSERIRPLRKGQFWSHQDMHWPYLFQGLKDEQSRKKKICATLTSVPFWNVCNLSRVKCWGQRICQLWLGDLCSQHQEPQKASETWSGTTQWQAMAKNGLGSFHQWHRQIKRPVRHPGWPPVLFERDLS